MLTALLLLWVPCCTALQLVHEFRILLLLGRRLVYPDGNSDVKSITTKLDTISGDTKTTRTVNLLFPANKGTIRRLLEVWRSCKVQWGSA